MSKVWFLILVSAIVTLLFRDPTAAINAMIKGSHASVNLAMELVALYAFWLGLFAIIEKIGLAEKLSKLLKPVIRFLFPGVNKECEKCITMNVSANILGLGNASTPMAIKAIGQMDADKNGRASQNMIMLVVISCTSLQLLPTTVIGLRATHGSVNPTDFLLPATVATIVSTILGITFVKVIGLLIRKFAKNKAENAEIVPIKEITMLKAPLSMTKVEKSNLHTPLSVAKVEKSSLKTSLGENKSDKMPLKDRIFNKNKLKRAQK